MGAIGQFPTLALELKIITYHQKQTPTSIKANSCPGVACGIEEQVVSYHHPSRVLRATPRLLASGYFCVIVELLIAHITENR